MSWPDRLGDRLGELSLLAVDAVAEMRDAGTGLFSHKAVVADGGYRNREANVLYSTVSLVGLLSQRRRLVDDVLPLGATLDAVHAAAIERDRPIELANLAWASVLAGDSRLDAALSRLVEFDPRSSGSSEIGQVLYGLTVGAEVRPALRDRAQRAARACVDELLRRFNPRADVFRASPRLRVPRRALIEAGITSFASQVYPLHGLAAFYLASGETPSPALARVAARIVTAQGPLGQWWWLYSCRHRRVLEGYPVYSVHQDGMAFLGLVELERLGLGSFAEPLGLGLDWVFGENELGVSLVEREPGMINRCIQRVGSDADGAYGLSRANFSRAVARSFVPWAIGDRTAAQPEGLEVLRECRSYHLGWLMYADSLVQRITSEPPGAVDGGASR